jgi:hypothetical protein
VGTFETSTVPTAVADDAVAIAKEALALATPGPWLPVVLAEGYEDGATKGDADYATLGARIEGESVRLRAGSPRRTCRDRTP